MANERRGGLGERWVMGAVMLAWLGGTAGCFQDQVMGAETADDDDAGQESSGGVTPGESGDLPLSTGGTDELPGGGSGDSGRSTTGTLDGGSDRGDEGVDASTSGGESEDETTGGLVLGVDALGPGDLVVTEIMVNPHCGGDECEWIEIYNATDAVVNLLDLFIQDGGYDVTSQGRVTQDVLVEPGGLAVIARGDNLWPYAFIPAAYYGPNPGLDNGEPDRVVLRNSAEILDETEAFFDPDQGVARSLSADAIDAASNDLIDEWCDAITPLPTTLANDEFGSPGLPNPPC